MKSCYDLSKVAYAKQMLQVAQPNQFCHSVAETLRSIQRECQLHKRCQVRQNLCPPVPPRRCPPLHARYRAGSVCAASDGIFCCVHPCNTWQPLCGIQVDLHGQDISSTSSGAKMWSPRGMEVCLTLQVCMTCSTTPKRWHAHPWPSIVVWPSAWIRDPHCTQGNAMSALGGTALDGKKWSKIWLHKISARMPSNKMTLSLQQYRQL